MNFFCKKNEYDLYVNEMELSEEDIFCLDVNEALYVAKMIFSVTDI